MKLRTFGQALETIDRLSSRADGERVGPVLARLRTAVATEQYIRHGALVDSSDEPLPDKLAVLVRETLAEKGFITVAGEAHA